MQQQSDNLANNQVPSQDTFTLVLSELYQGAALVIPNAQCEFTYDWNFQTGMGSASLNSINGAPVNIPMFPLGIKGYLDFMSDMEATEYNINGQMVVIDRVVLDIQLSNNNRSAGIIFNADGSVIQTTPNFGSENVSKLTSKKK